MKESRYNYIMERDNVAYWYNGIEHKYFRLPLALSRKVEAAIAEPAALPEAFVEKLYNGGFLVADGTDELAVIRSRNDERINRRDYMLIILPTLNCNYKCWYCIQDHIPSKMSDQTIDLVKRHIYYMVVHEHVTSLNLEWFGGEPFMYFENVVSPICEYAKQVCAENNISYNASATTNGYFLTSEKFSDIINLGFNRFQITLDGAKKDHDRVKFQTGCTSAFERVLGNIENLLNASDSSLQFLLRVNYTEENLCSEIVDDVNALIAPSNRARIQISAKKVWQESVSKSRYNNVSELLDLFEDSGYSVNRLDVVTDFVPCYANRKYYNAINYNGDVLKCTACNDLYDKSSHGVIQDDGSVSWNPDFIAQYEVKSFENAECLACKYLPVCMGLCPRDYGNNSYCKLDGMDVKIEDALVGYINSMCKTQN